MSNPTTPPIQVDSRPGYYYVTLQSDLDSATAEPIREALEQLVGTAAGARLVIDLAGVPFFDSAGLGALVSVYRSTRARHGEAASIVLVNPSQESIELLLLTHLDRYLPWYRSLHAAQAVHNWIVP